MNHSQIILDVLFFLSSLVLFEYFIQSSSFVSFSFTSPTINPIVRYGSFSAYF